jgi:hypothetical protein
LRAADVYRVLFVGSALEKHRARHVALHVTAVSPPSARRRPLLPQHFGRCV